MDPSIRKGVRRRTEWIRRNPGGAGDYIRLKKVDRDRVDQLFMSERRLKANEVQKLVEKLTEERLLRRRTGDARARALANLRSAFGDTERYRDKTVVANVRKMTSAQTRIAASADVDHLLNLARVQEEGNPFWYH
jgi:hypothetical protein